MKPENPSELFAKAQRLCKNKTTPHVESRAPIVFVHFDGHTEKLHVNLDCFLWLCLLFPNARWSLRRNGAYAASRVRDPKGEPFELYIERALAFRKMLQREEETGKRAPNKGWCAKFRDGNPMNCCLENVAIVSGKGKKQSYQAAWTIRERMKRVSNGMTPEPTPRGKSRKRNPKPEEDQ